MKEMSEPTYALVVTIAATLILLISIDAFAWSGTPQVAHHFDEPDLGKYSVPGVCEPIHDANAPVVTLAPRELLQEALDRLPSTGGVIEVPFGTGVSCDSLTIKDHYPSGITIRGLPYKGRFKPKFYCRGDDYSERRDREMGYNLGGFIPFDEVEPHWLAAWGTDVLIENIEIDGYKSALVLGSSGNHVVRNSYFHHGPDSGIGSTNTGGPNKDPYRGIEDYNRFSLEVCGSEVSHYGQGNHRHNFYMHRGLGGGGENPYWMSQGAYDTWSEITVVDSFIHSAGWASNFKSIANKNVLINNVIMSNNTSVDPAKDYSRFHAQMAIDVPACSINIIEGNTLENFKPTKSAGGSALIGLRSRRTAMRGCEIPFVWSPYKLPDSPWPIAKDPNDPVHTEEWWIAQQGKIWFPTLIKNNKFSVEGEFAHRQTAVERSFTTPVYESVRKISCLLPKPNAWYERSEVTMEGNTFEGFNPLKILIEKRRFHHKNCPVIGDPNAPL